MASAQLLTKRGRGFSFGLFLLLAIPSQAQVSSCAAGPVPIDDAIGSLHAKRSPLTTQDDSELITVTFKQRVSGVAVVQVDVNSAGHVITAVPVSGPRQLADLFADRARETTFYPFK